MIELLAQIKKLTRAAQLFDLNLRSYARCDCGIEIVVAHPCERMQLYGWVLTSRRNVSLSGNSHSFHKYCHAEALRPTFESRHGQNYYCTNNTLNGTITGLCTVDFGQITG